MHFSFALKLQGLISQLLWHYICSLNWQHQLCKNPRPNPDIKTLFVDHSCGQPNGARAPSPVTNHLMGAVPKTGAFAPLGPHGVSWTTTYISSGSKWSTSGSLTLNVYACSPFSPHLLRFQHLLLDGWPTHHLCLIPLLPPGRLVWLQLAIQVLWYYCGRL